MKLSKVATPSFLVALVVLTASAAGMKTAISWLGLHLIKEPVPLRRNLEMIPSEIGPYKVIKKEPRLKSDVEAELGTSTYITWQFEDERKEATDAGRVIRVHIPYYTGTIDSAPHVPDRCWVGGSQAEIMEKAIETFEMASPRIEGSGLDVMATTEKGDRVKLPSTSLPMTVVKFSHPGGGSESVYVAYLFVANDSYVATPEGVRLKAFNVTDRYAYYCKVEIRAVGANSIEEAARLTGEACAYILPELFLCLPDWDALKTEDRNEGTDTPADAG